MSDGKPTGALQNGAKPAPHTFSRSDLKYAVHTFDTMIKKYFGEVWHIKSDGEYKAVDWWCKSPLLVDTGIWYLIQAAQHRGAKRATGRIEVKEAGTVLRFILCYEPVKPEIIKP